MIILPCAPLHASDYCHGMQKISQCYYERGSMYSVHKNNSNRMCNSYIEIKNDVMLQQ